MENVIKIEGLCKSFGDIKAVDNLSFNVKEGELFAFLGINGAGKSTTISIIVFINGENIDSSLTKIKNDLGVVFQNSVLDKSLSVYDNLKSRAALYGICGAKFKERLNELCEMLDFKDLLKREVKKLSGGQRRRIDVARALMHNPKILILDEPTTGLDPQTRKTLWNVIDKLRHERKMTVFLTTHYMEEAADADYVVIIDSGKISAEGTPLQLKNAYTGDFITLYGAKKAEVESLGMPYEEIRDAYRVAVPNTAAATELIVKYPQIFEDYEITKGKMDDVFLAVTGKKLLGGAEK